MFSVSHKRWRIAQNAEKQTFNYRTDKKPHANSEFFSQNFLIGSEFFCDKDILEVGCSPLATIHSIKEAHFKVGIDPLAGEWTCFYEKSTSHIQGMGEYLPFKDGCFDAVLCLNVLDHVQAPSEVLNEIRGCLKERSTLILWLQTFSTFKVIKKLLGLFDNPHPHHFSDSDVFSLLKDMGYCINYHKYRKANIHSAISVIKKGLIVSGLKSLFANLLLGLHESSYMCSKGRLKFNENIRQSR